MCAQPSRTPNPQILSSLWVHLHVCMLALLETTFHLRALIPTVNRLFMHVHASSTRPQLMSHY
jgi:hypothetical protein